MKIKKSNDKCKYCIQSSFLCPWSRRIESGVDKAAVLDMLLLQHAAASSEHVDAGASSGAPAAGGMSVYVGDSMSDLAPLLSADLGIVVGQNKLLRRVAAAAGITLRPLVAGWGCILALADKTQINALVFC